ncbi:glycine betaine ABC transporter substrate-binding protein [Niveibacterium sp. SC-1]|uniref:ABC transporter permease/substrate-binding protein n=1 Tax=Niveibacterium sp. SC-1 TaxID=3135646 RepID=UPI00311EE841
MRALVGWAALAGALLASSSAWAAEPGLRVGSKRFTESYVLGEILTQTAARFGPAQHVQGLGNTTVVFNALRQGSIDLYPEYTGTLELEILRHEKAGASLDALNRELAPMGLGVAVPLGFNNTYAIAVSEQKAHDQQLKRIGDLATHRETRFGISHEFLGRADGWPGLAQRYGLPQTPTGLDHGIAYEAVANGQVDAIDIYSTDAKIARYHLRVLEDDRGYFPRYEALILYRLDAAQRAPQAWAALQQLAGRIDADTMIRLNAQAELDGRSFADVARQFLAGSASPKSGASSWADKMFGPDLARLTLQHLMLVFLSVVAACAIGIPLGVLAAESAAGGVLLAAVGVLQTIPSLALLAVLIPVFGRIGTLPALAALFLYALLPIVANTVAGLREVPAGLKTAAQALGLGRAQILHYIELPLAGAVILAGIRSAAVIGVGTATIAAFIGAGGLGERITIGLAVNDHQMLLAGAIPAAVLALLIDGLFRLAERRLRHP